MCLYYISIYEYVCIIYLSPPILYMCIYIYICLYMETIEDKYYISNYIYVYISGDLTQ